MNLEADRLSVNVCSFLRGTCREDDFLHLSPISLTFIVLVGDVLEGCQLCLL
jgi:hypothetical protein